MLTFYHYQFELYDDTDDQADLLAEDKKKMIAYYLKSRLSCNEDNLPDGAKKKIVASLVRAHADPSYNECRAYGRLVDKKLNGKIAVHCYGHMSISATVEDELEQRFGVNMWNRPAEGYNKPVSKRTPLRAIVKDLVREDVDFAEKNIKSACSISDSFDASVYTPWT